MLIADLPNLETLPRQNASQVKNKWGDVVRLVRQRGSVAITNHASVEMVLLDAVTYQHLTEDIRALKARENTVVDDLAARFDARLAVLQEPAAGRNLDELLEAKGKLTRRPQAGASF